MSHMRTSPTARATHPTLAHPTLVHPTLDTYTRQRAEEQQFHAIEASGVLNYTWQRAEEQFYVHAIEASGVYVEQFNLLSF